MTEPSPPDPPPDPALARPPKPWPRAGLVGPLFRWELVRLARRGQDARARFILAAALFVALGLFTLLWFPDAGLFGGGRSLSLQESARFGELFSVAFVVSQLVVLALLTPAYAAGGISEEKERKTFVYVLVSDLTSREIFLGKFLGRLTFLLGVLFAGLPILAITQLYGGVSVHFLIAAYLVTTTTVVLLAAMSAAAAAAVNTYRGALFRAYGLTALHLFVGCVHPVLSPVGILVLVLWNLDGHDPVLFWVVTVGYGAGQLAVAFLAVLLAVYWVRRQRAAVGVAGRPHRPTPERRPREPADPTVVTALPIARPRPRRRPPPTLTPPSQAAPARPRIGRGDPFAWKEWHTTGRQRTADDEALRSMVLAVGIAVGIVVGLVALIALLGGVTAGATGRPTTLWGWVLFLLAAGSLMVHLMQVGVAAAGSIVRERQRLTLELLLALPVERRRILAPKWRASAAKAWVWGLPAVGLLPLGFLVGGAPLAAVPAMWYVPAAVALATSVGLWLGIRSPTQTRATLWLMLLIGALVAAPLVAWAVLDGLGAAAGMAALTGLLALGAGLTWRRAVAAFEQVGRG